MSIKTNDALANKRLDGSFNAGAGVDFNNGTVKFYTGAQPATADTAVTGVLLATIALAADAFGNAAARAVAALGVPLSVNSVAAGTIGYARIASSTGTYVIDCDVSLTGAGSPVTVDNTTLTVGQQLQITSLSISE